METLSASSPAQRALGGLQDRLSGLYSRNANLSGFYRGEYRIPMVAGDRSDQDPAMRNMAIGWAATVVDSIEERIALLGWGDADGDVDELLDQVYAESDVKNESSAVHTDTLIHGVGFVTVTRGGEGEPPVLIRGYSAEAATAEISPRTGLAEVALTRSGSNRAEVWTNVDVTSLVRTNEHAPWRVEQVVEHGLGVVPVVPVINSSRTARRRGRSEITPALQSYIASATRALRSMDANRIFFSTPQRYAIGLSADQFAKSDGTIATGWDLVSKNMLMAPAPGKDEAEPKFGEFSTVSPGPYLEQIRGLAELAATESGVPAAYFGLTPKGNPSSADGIRAGESRLIKRCERKCAQFTAAWAQVGRIAKAILLEVPVTDVPLPVPRWGNPATPTLAATADAWTKLVTSGIVPGQSEVVWQRLGLTDSERSQLRRDVEESLGLARIQALAGVTRGVSEEALSAADVEAAGHRHSD